MICFPFTFFFSLSFSPYCEVSCISHCNFLFIQSLVTFVSEEHYVLFNLSCYCSWAKSPLLFINDPFSLLNHSKYFYIYLLFKVMVHLIFFFVPNILLFCFSLFYKSVTLCIPQLLVDFVFFSFKFWKHTGFLIDSECIIFLLLKS